MSNCDNKNSCFIDNNERDNDHADSRSNINSQVNTNAVNSLTSRKVLLHRDKEKLAKKL